jgi:hypothetical protein
MNWMTRLEFFYLMDWMECSEGISWKNIDLHMKDAPVEESSEVST